MSETRGRYDASGRLLLRPREAGARLMATVAGTALESGGWWAMLRGGTEWHAMPSWLAVRAVCGLPVLEVLARQERAPERGLCRRCAGLAHPAATVTGVQGS